MLNWFKKSKENVIEVSDEDFNPTKELVNLYKLQIISSQERIDSLVAENKSLRDEVLTLKTKNSSIPAVEVSNSKHFITFSGLKAELEARDRKRKAELDAEAKSINNNS